MSVLEALFLGILQGLTEFLPISSSGHLVVLQHFFGIKEPILLFDVVLHMGTLFAITLFLKTEIKTLLTQNPFKNKENMSTWKNIFISLIPTGLIGLIIEKNAGFIFTSPKLVGILLIITASFLVLPSVIRLSYTEHITGFKALLVGISQGIAVLPGISRSGITIVTGLLLGINGEQAGKFSFLISCPAILGALSLELLKAYRIGNAVTGSLSVHVYLLGFVSAFVVGYLSLSLLMWILKKGSHGRLHWFSPYCLSVGLLLILFA